MIKLFNRQGMSWCLLALAGALQLGACRKTDYPTVQSPAYLRVFNDLTYNVTLDNKDAPPPYLIMMIDPVMGDSSAPVSAAITCDYLNTRGELARPYPDAGNTSLWQTEFPGTMKVAVGPILNGYDLSSYGQVPSGKHRFVFATRPLSNAPFFSLSAENRKHFLVDTVLDLQQGEVYTMNILEQSVYTAKTIAYVRQEQFTRQSFSDSAVYVNFYNLSAEGYNQTFVYDEAGGNLNRNLKDTMNVYYTLFGTSPGANQPGQLPGYQNVFMTTMLRSQEPVAHPYYHFPLFPIPSWNRIYAGQQSQKFTFSAPSNPSDHLDNGANVENYGNAATVSIGPVAGTAVYNIMADQNTGLIISIRSGIYNPRSFATINTIEYVNGNVYLTVLQRKYDPPIY
ncbi:hypothetical protein DCC81_24985 [Chitinophaga parva]|uniref:DUF4249 domain-containing protein n=1 Tax=Chitinophaga parva TaxID=2169414 RepID=A0A2T7BBS6_9BACT|nr:hypothetical protein [Chitinophaga parva]PUZ21845.1 hypothetical protein DCC81_24985 [Chitinophaga parva]